MSDEEPWTIGRLLRWTTEFLEKHGADSPRLEAEVLLAHARGCQRILLYTVFDEPAPDELRTAFRELVKRRGAGEPVAHLVGHREFYSLDFEVTPDVLIPRPETELVVLTLVDRAKERAATLSAPRIADIGAGSGVLAVCAAKHVRGARITAVDKSPAALQIARRNAAKHKVEASIKFYESDLFAAVPAAEEFDFIVSNPPYIRSDELPDLPRDVRDHEPRLALDGGPEGTTVIERLLPQAAERLAPGGVLLIEISPTTVARVEELVRRTPGLELRPTIADLERRPRVVEATAADAPATAPS